MARQGLHQHRKFLRLIRLLGVPVYVARGVLEVLWDPAYETGDDSLGTPEDIADRVGWTQDPIALLSALLGAGFIEADSRVPGEYRIHDLYDHAPEYVKRRVRLEIARREAGQSITDLRAEAGRKGASVRWAHRIAGPLLPSGEHDSNNPESLGNVHQKWQTDSNALAKVPTPAPAPAPAPALKSLVDRGPTSAASLQNLWNRLASEKLPKWREMPALREKRATAAMKARPLAQWEELIAHVNRSSFCTGSNERGWRADPDWLLQPGTATKILEGKYDDRKASRSSDEIDFNPKPEKRE